MTRALGGRSRTGSSERRLRRACYDRALHKYAWWQIVRARMCSYGSQRLDLRLVSIGCVPMTEKQTVKNDDD